jgi:uncharacterized protein (TIGR03382 family)
MTGLIAAAATSRPAAACTCEPWEPDPGIADGAVDVPRNTGFLYGPEQALTLRDADGVEVELDLSIDEVNVGSGPAGEFGYARPVSVLEPNAVYQLMIDNVTTTFTTGADLDETPPVFSNLEILDAWYAAISPNGGNSCFDPDGSYGIVDLDFDVELETVAIVSLNIVDQGGSGHTSAVPAEAPWVDSLRHLSTGDCSIRPTTGSSICIDVSAYDLAGNVTVVSACGDMSLCAEVDLGIEEPTPACVPPPPPDGDDDDDDDEGDDDDDDDDDASDPGAGCSATGGLGGGAPLAFAVAILLAGLSRSRRRAA